MFLRRLRGRGRGKEIWKTSRYYRTYLFLGLPLLGNMNDDFKKVNIEKLDLNQLPELEQYMLHRVFQLNKNQSTFIPKGETHRLENNEKIPLEIIEIQTGNYLGEDDIIRLDDNYHRD